MRSHPLISTPAVAAAAVPLLAAVSLLAAGCGGSSRPAATVTHNPLITYADCMRSHGVANFPDPTSSGAIPKDRIPHVPQLRSASSACRRVIPATGLGPPPTSPQTRTRVADGLSFARCVRSHGVTRFPDPTPQGELSVEMVQAQGIDVHSPAVLHIVQACLPASHGALTPAKVREALSHAGG